MKKKIQNIKSKNLIKFKLIKNKKRKGDKKKKIKGLGEKKKSRKDREENMKVILRLKRGSVNNQKKEKEWKESNKRMKIKESMKKKRG